MSVDDDVHPKEQGQRSEAAVMFEFVRRGLTVLLPFGDNERYDVVIEESGTFYRVQVKTGRMENGRVQFETRSSGTLTRRVEKQGYEGAIDVFAVYSPDLERTFVVPIAEAPATSMGLRVNPARKRSRRINWADDYSIDTWIDAIAEHGSSREIVDVCRAHVITDSGRRASMVTTKEFTCVTCDYEFESPAGLAQHVAVDHRECAACGETFESVEDLDEHTKARH